MMTEPLTVQSAVARAARGEIVLLDVREPAEIAASGTAAGALRIPLGVLPLKADPKAPDAVAALGAGKPVAVFCAAGARAGRAADLLRGFGIEAHGIGGFGDWCAAGGQTER